MTITGHGDSLIHYTVIRANNALSETPWHVCKHVIQGGAFGKLTKVNTVYKMPWEASSRHISTQSLSFRQACIQMSVSLASFRMYTHRDSQRYMCVLKQNRNIKITTVFITAMWKALVLQVMSVVYFSSAKWVGRL